MRTIVGLLVFAWALAGHGWWPPASHAQEDVGAGESRGDAALPLGHASRYRVPYMHSSTATAIRSATVVSITNQSAVSCATSVDWRIGFGGVACTTTLTLGPGQSGEHCSRPLPIGVTTCNATCSPALLATEGNAVVGSRAITGCERIAVDVRLFHTTGSADGSVAGLSSLKVVRFGVGNAGD